MNERASQNNLFLIGMILSMTCWGFSWTSGKILSAYGDPLTISFLRFALTFVSLIFILMAMKEKMLLSTKGAFDLIAASVLISVYTYLFFKGVTVGKAGAGGVLVTVLNPIITYAITIAVARRKPSRNEFIGLMLGLAAGIVLLKLVTEADEIFKAGNIYFLLAACSWSVLSRFTAKATRYGSSLAFSFWMYGISTVLMFLFSGVGSTMETFSKSDWTFWGNLFFSATITTSLATTFYFVATSKVGASKASSFIFMVPFSAALGSWIFLDEVIELHTIIGGLLGIAAVYILNKKEVAKASAVARS
jgi:drug/metabolite transporter (DMT)-like permease